LIISLSKDVFSSSTFSIWIDDVSQGPTYYGFKNGFSTEIGQAPEQESFTDITNISRDSNLDRFVNTGVRIGNISGGLANITGGGSGSIAAAKNVRFNDLFGPKVALREGGKFKNINDIYSAAKALINVNYKDV